MSSSRALDELKEKKHPHTLGRMEIKPRCTQTNATYKHSTHTHAHKQVVFILNTWSHRVTVMFQ